MLNNCNPSPSNVLCYVCVRPRYFFAAGELAVEEHPPSIFPFSEVMIIKIIPKRATNSVWTLRGRRRSLSPAGNGTLTPLLG